MSLALTAGIGALVLWALPIGLLGATMLKHHDLELEADDFIAVLVAIGLSVTLFGSEILATTGVLSRSTFLILGASITVAVIVTLSAVQSLRQRFRHAAFLLPLMLLPILVGTLATIPQLLSIIRFPALLPSSTPWYYFSLAQQTVSAGAFPISSMEWGVSVPFLNDYPAFTALTAALSMASGSPTLTFGAQIMRGIAAVGAGFGFFCLARAWGASRFAAAGGVFALMATTVFSIKTLSYRPEAFSYLLLFLTAAMAKRWLDERDPAFLIAGMATFAALAHVHGLGWVLAVIILIATAVAHIVMHTRDPRAAIVGVLTLAVIFTVSWVGTSLLLRGQVSDFGKLDTVPVTATDGTDPTWQFAAFGTEFEDAAPPTIGSLIGKSVTRGIYGNDAWALIALVASSVILVGGAAMQRGSDGRRAREVLLMGIFVLFGGIAVSVIFALGWDTYVPRRTGAGRIMQLVILILPLVASIGASRLGKHARSAAGTTIWFAIGASLLTLVAPQLIDNSTRVMPQPEVFASQMRLELEPGLALANAYTEGYLPIVFGVPGLLDGRAPYTEAVLLDRANLLLSDAREYFSDPTHVEFDFARYGIRYVIVTDRSWVLGTPRWFPADVDALRSTPSLSLIENGDGFYLFQVVGESNG